MLFREILSNPTKIALIVLALVLITATALPLLRFDHWWIRVLDFPRKQLAIAGIVLFALYLYVLGKHRLYDSVILGFLLMAVGYQLVKIFPYTVLMPKQVLAADSPSGEGTLGLLIINVQMDNRASEALFALVDDYDPDVILTMETDDWWEASLRELEENYPHTLKRPLDNTYGMLVHSRLELIDPDIRHIIKDSIPSMHMQVLLASGNRVFMHFVHPDPPNPLYATETTQRDAELLVVGRDVGKRDRPTLVAGDFNDVPWSTTTNLFQSISGLLDPRVGRGMYNTYHANNPFLRWPLDHVFHSAHFKLVRMATGPAWGSDHLPVYIELRLTEGAELEQEEEGADAEEAEQVDEKIEDGKQQEAE
ncbi:endonuclease/exonuclease/phosphatase family protein [Marinimicrobium alkaliphilum]|uniref:endonuclease/exonuclease/phosphatase family protein n=1 Tax=Marinimicrobium alkaliphilum TaxID=2202654 RepID=UPI000DBA244C|nr:endonuclease/exonuclease/phosphatase family protein [Marinimicrobium alkaliphilum]